MPEQTQNTETTETNEQETYLQEKIARQEYLANLIAQTKTERDTTTKAIKQLKQAVSPLNLTQEELASEETLQYHDELLKTNKQLVTDVYTLEKNIMAIANKAEELKEAGRSQTQIDRLIGKAEEMLLDFEALKQEQALVMAEGLILERALRSVSETTDESTDIALDDEKVEDILKTILPDIEMLAENYKVQTTQINTFETEFEAVNREIEGIVFAQEEANKVLEQEQEREIFDTIVLINDLLDWDAPAALIDEIIKANTATEEQPYTEKEAETEEMVIEFEPGVAESLFATPEETTLGGGSSEEEESKSEESSLVSNVNDFSALARIPSMMSTSSSGGSKSSSAASQTNSNKQRF